MTAYPIRAIAWSATATTLTVSTLVGLGAGFGGTERMVERGFAAAIESRNLAANAPQHETLAQLSGSEEFWLNAARPIAGTVPVAWGGPLAVGDQVTLTSAGRERRLDVVDIRPIGQGAESGGRTAPLLLVTCEDPQHPGELAVRFVIERDARGPNSTGKAPHAL